jgi:hypothetical protein
MALMKFLVLRRPPLRDAACGGSSGQGGRFEEPALAKAGDAVRQSGASSILSPHLALSQTLTTSICCSESVTKPD